MNDPRRVVAIHLATFFFQPFLDALAADRVGRGWRDLSDLFEEWEAIEGIYQRARDASDETTRRHLQDFDGHLTNTFYHADEFPNGEQWDWLYDLKRPRPKIWRQAAALAQQAFNAMGRLNLDAWQAEGFPLR